MLVFDPVKKEAGMLRANLSDYAAGHLSDDWRIVSETSLKTLADRVESYTDVRLYCCDVAAGGDSQLGALREISDRIFVIVIADEDTSPLVYIRPNIMAAGILLRPFTGPQVERVLSEVFDAVLAYERRKLFGGEYFTVETREETVRVPYSDILCFESRAKKIVLCTASSEISFYSTLDSLMEKTPDYFIRVHKSFIANSLLVKKVSMSQSLLTMPGGFEIPISRSYRVAVKEALL